MTHTYGPHDPTTAQMTIEVGRPGRYQGTEVVPVHPAIIRQRQQLNDLAAGVALKAEGQARAAAAHPNERAAIESAIRRHAATGRVFSANTLRAEGLDIGGGVVGAVFGELSRAKVIRHVGYEPSTKPNTKAHDIKTWIGAAA